MVPHVAIEKETRKENILFLKCPSFHAICNQRVIPVPQYEFPKTRSIYRKEFQWATVLRHAEYNPFPSNISIATIEALRRILL